MQQTHRIFAAIAALGTIASAGCSSDGATAPSSSPSPVIGVQATAMGASSIRISFAARSGESYDIERAEAAGAFVAGGSLPASTADGTATFTDVGLKVSTTYRYRVTAIRGSSRSAASSEVTATTLAFGSASATISTDITANRTLYADTAYLLSGFVHVANGATLTIQPGTTIRGDFNTLGSSLMIMRGAKIQAVEIGRAHV